MPRSQGFARGDLDTAFPLDDKFLALRGRLTADRYYAATGVYFHVVAATWREADRKTAIRIVPDAADLIDELVAVGLLSADGKVTTRAFNAWIGRARRARKASTERQAKSRAARSPVRLSQEVTPMSHATASDTAGTVGTVGRNGRNGREPAREPDILDAYRRQGLPVDVA